MWLGLLVTFCSLIAFTYGFTKFAVRLFKNVVIEVVDDRLKPMLDYQQGMTPRVDSLFVELADVKAQLHPNGGSSLRDQVNLISERMGVDVPSNADQRGHQTAATD